MYVLCIDIGMFCVLTYVYVLYVLSCLDVYQPTYITKRWQETVSYIGDKTLAKRLAEKAFLSVKEHSKHSERSNCVDVDNDDTKNADP